MIREAAGSAAGWRRQPVRAQLARRRFGYAGTGAEFPLTRTCRPDGTIAVALTRATLLAHPPMICLERHFDPLERRGESPRDLLGEMVSMGYRFESTTGHPLAMWRRRRSLMAIVRVVAR